MSNTKYGTQVNDFLVIQLVGDLNTYIAQVVQADPLRVKVTEAGPHANLIEEDFVIKAQQTLMIQQDARDDTCVFLQQQLDAGRKVYSGLESLGVSGGRSMRDILPPQD